MRSIIHSAISSNPCALSPPRSRRLLLVSIGFAALFVAVAAGGAPPGFTTSVKPYAISISPEYATKPILSVGDRVPLTSDSSRQFQMIGVPDGLGAYQADDGSVVLYMNHEVA